MSNEGRLERIESMVQTLVNRRQVREHRGAGHQHETAKWHRDSGLRELLSGSSTIILT